MTVKQSTIDQFRPQRANRNKHKERGMGALEASMRKLGYVAPMTAAHNLNRRCFGAEISPAYCGVILQRFLDHTGIEPQLIES